MLRIFTALSHYNEDYRIFLADILRPFIPNNRFSEFGIDSSRLQTAGKGSSEPVSTENTVTAKALNRRVTISKL